MADGLGALVAGLHGNEIHRHVASGDIDAVSYSLHGVMLAQLAIGVIGVLYVTGEYATGSIRSSMAAVPKRTPVLVGKASVFAVITGLVSLAMTFIAFFAGQAILSAWNLNVSLGYHGALRALLGTALYLVCVGLMGLGFGFALRSTGGAIATLFGVVLVLPLIVASLPHSWQADITRFLPLTIADTMMTTGPAEPGTLSNGWGAALLIGYALITLLIGLVVLKRRDV